MKERFKGMVRSKMKRPAFSLLGKLFLGKLMENLHVIPL